MFARRSTIRHPVTRLRASLGKSPANFEETLICLRNGWRSSKDHSQNLFRFPWGLVEYVQFGQLSSQFKEIFLDHVYSFEPAHPAPVIIDCGGNIGMSCIWFKQTFPKSQVTVYEADPHLSGILERNLARADVKQVIVVNKAVWTSNGTVSFDRTGDDSGKISNQAGSTLPAIDLAEALPARVDLLKLDIEGAEYAVVEHLCATRRIDRVMAIVAEFHVWRDRTDDLLAAMGRLRKAGFTLSFSATPCPWIGRARSPSPFAAIGDDQVLMMLYAWRDQSSQ